MGRNKIPDADETLAMIKARELVLEIYPDAHLSALTNKMTSNPPEIYIIRINKEPARWSDKNKTQNHILAVASTIEKAWNGAWKSIQRQLLERFEQ